jgi:hypothetical protein
MPSESFFASLTRAACNTAPSTHWSTSRPPSTDISRKPKPFVWTADPDRIIEKVNRGYQVMASDH